jgi:hypothetical protein
MEGMKYQNEEFLAFYEVEKLIVEIVMWDD